MSGRGSHSGGRSSEVERIIAAAEVDTTFAGKKARYRGRRSTWPGALALFLIAAGSVFGIVYYGIQLKENVNETVASDAAVRQYSSGTPISDGRPAVEDADITVTNPVSYTDNKCQQPNFVSKNGKIVAVFADNSEVQIDIKGVNWLGMQDSNGVPKGLWDNAREGSTLYRIGQFLSNNNFNVVRLPISVDSALRNTDITISLINTNSQRALEDVTNYLKMISLIVQGLGQFKIGVVLDFHVLSPTTVDDGLWYGTSIQLADTQTAIDNLAKQLCNGKHFNVMGIDLKDGIGAAATWGDGSDTDWAAAATTLGNHVIKACPQWLSFIQGIQGSSHKDLYDDGAREVKSKFPAGSDLTGVATAPIKLSTSGKVVYSPKYFTNSYSPYAYFFDKGGVSKGDMIEDYIESSDANLRKNVLANMNYMFGSTYATGSAVVLSSFGGLLGTDEKTPKLTSTRIVQVLIEQMLATEKSLAGGFWWTLNPDTFWPYPAPDNSNTTSAGLVDETWRAANMNVLNQLKNMDKMASIKFIPCVV